MSISPGQPVPDFSATATGGQNVRLSELRGHWILLYFYPRDHTPGCTLEGQQFRDLHDRFTAHNTVIFGVSRDSLHRHEQFRAKHGFPFHLLTDTDEVLCRIFDVIKLKKQYGKESLGVERSTFLIDPDGVLHREWRKIKVDGHAHMVLAALEAITTSA